MLILVRFLLDLSFGLRVGVRALGFGILRFRVEPLRFVL